MVGFAVVGLAVDGFDVVGCARNGKGAGGEWVGGRERERVGEKKSGDWGGCGNCVGIPGRNVFGFCYVRESEEIEGVCVGRQKETGARMGVGENAVVEQMRRGRDLEEELGKAWDTLREVKRRRGEIDITRGTCMYSMFYHTRNRFQLHAARRHRRLQ